MLVNHLFGEGFETIKVTPLHEAFIVQEAGSLVSEIVPMQPPEPIQELVPQQQDDEARWIPGYWGWSRSLGLYFWVSGTWRRPPPGHEWVEGHWKKYGDGWIWIKGTWSLSKNLTYIPLFPPDPLEESVEELAAGMGDYFWIPGQWEYEAHGGNYVWRSGKWELFNPEWILTPSHYIWRDEGYVYIPAFWDWPLAKRGSLYSPIYVDPILAQNLTFEPSKPLGPLSILELLFPHWPDYAHLFQFDFHYNYEAWVSWGAAPPWWQWPTWWTLTPQDAWWLWWWWTHPGYPNPSWIDLSYAKGITPASPRILKMIQNVPPTVNITPNGVVGDAKILHALRLISGKSLPILPSDPKQIIQIKEVAQSMRPKAPYLQAEGMHREIHSLPKPFFPSSQRPESKTIPIPPLPARINNLTSPCPPEQSQLTQYETPRADPTPLAPYTPLPDNPLSDPTMEPPELPLYRYPSQRTPSYPYSRRRLPPMETEHHNYFMTNPQPLQNPPGPEVNQYPGNYSTLPGE